jgi:hypothetical protein
MRRRCHMLAMSIPINLCNSMGRDDHCNVWRGGGNPVTGVSDLYCATLPISVRTSPSVVEHCNLEGGGEDNSVYVGRTSLAESQTRTGNDSRLRFLLWLALVQCTAIFSDAEQLNTSMATRPFHVTVHLSVNEHTFLSTLGGPIYYNS